MAQRQFRSDDTSRWKGAYGDKSDGDWAPTTSTLTEIDAPFTGTAGNLNGSATNASFAAGQKVIIIQMYGSGAGNWELNQLTGYSAGAPTFKYPLMNNYVTGAQMKVMKQYRNVNIASGQTIRVKDWTSGGVGGVIAFFANGTVTIAGSLRADGSNASTSSPNSNTPTSGGGFRGGNGWRSSSQAAFDGDGTVQLLAQSNGGSVGNAGGGGRSSGGDSGGGGGGNGASGSAGSSNSGTGGLAGAAAGNAGLTSMVMGGGGGGGRTDDDQGGQGGSGGGIILVIGKYITVTGSVNSNGGNGFSVTQACGGGGAGGSILFKGITLTLGSANVEALAGAGGNTGGSQAGGAGSAGRIHADYARSITATTNPTIDSRQDKTLIPRQPGAGLLMQI